MKTIDKKVLIRTYTADELRAMSNSNRRYHGFVELFSQEDIQEELDRREDWRRKYQHSSQNHS